MNLKVLIGSGDKIMLFTSPFIIIGLILNIMYPEVFSVNGPSLLLMIISVIVLVPGIVVWIWSVILILTRVPKKRLITVGPYSVVKHPLYTGVSLLVIPWIGFLANSWLGVVIGLTIYIGSRIYSLREEEVLSLIFGNEWEKYCKMVKIPWL